MAEPRYSFTVCEPEVDYTGKRTHTYYVGLYADEFKKLKPVLQKRMVRKLVEAEWGAPVKNFTQKRAWYETFFEKTEKEPPNEFWTVVICQPAPAGEQNAWIAF